MAHGTVHTHTHYCTCLTLALHMQAMGNAAHKLDLTIQYCMPLPIFMLQSVEIPTVTNARASGDYHPGTSQWHIGMTR